MSRRRRGKAQHQAKQNSVSSNLALLRSSFDGNQHNSQKQSTQISNDNDFRLIGVERIHYLENLVSKQLELYTWCEEKVTTLATIDAILLAGATLFVEHIKTGVFPQRVINTWKDIVQEFIEKNFPLLMIGLMLLPIFFSLGITLWHVIPKMRSGATPSTIRNHRSSRGIHRYGSVPEYKNRMDTITEDEIYEDLVRQIFGMNTNIWRNQIIIKIAVFFDLVGLIGFLFIILYLVICGSNSAIFN